MTRRNAIMLLTMGAGMARQVRGENDQHLEPQPLCRGTEASGKVVFVPCGESRPKVEAPWIEVKFDGYEGLRVTKNGEVIELSATQILNALKTSETARDSSDSHGPAGRDFL
jgi:hypothetical protein